MTAEETLARVRQALAAHPRVCDRHPDDDPISCGWKSAVADVQAVLDEAEPAPCAYDPSAWQRGSFPGVDACDEPAEPGSEFCTAHNPDNL